MEFFWFCFVEWNEMKNILFAMDFCWLVEVEVRESGKKESKSENNFVHPKDYFK